jgi:S1-C subfamily serine protease
MRSQVAVPVLCAVLGGVVTAAALRVSGVVDPAATRTIIQQGPLLAASSVGGTSAGAVYRSGSAGVVAVRAQTVAAPPTAFDDGSASPGGVVTGAGVVVDDQGHILTAAHLVRAATSVEVDYDGHRAVARVVGLDPPTVLAVLDVGPQGLGVAPLSLGNSDEVSVGDPVVALGREPGAAPALAAGTIAARQTTLATAGGGRLDDVLQVDADLGASDVGGPLLDGSGQVIGVNTRMRMPDGEDSVDLAVPANTARRVLAQMLQSGQKVVGG